MSSIVRPVFFQFELNQITGHYLKFRIKSNGN